MKRRRITSISLALILTTCLCGYPCVAPTAAKLLGFEIPGAEGKPLLEALSK